MSGDGVLDRALAVFSLFSDDEPQLTASEIGERAGIPESSLFRLLTMLVDRGLLVRLRVAATASARVCGSSASSRRSRCGCASARSRTSCGSTR